MLFCFCAITAQAQFFLLKDGKKAVSLRFSIVRNMVIVPLHINGRGPFNFVLDTGVGLMIITDPKLVDSINIDTKRTLKLYGAGFNDAFEAYATNTLQVTLPGMSSWGVAAAILKTDHFGLSNYAGMPVHGLLGYEFFNRLTVKLNFSDSTLTAYAPGKTPRLKKYTKLAIQIEDRKPYINSKLALLAGQEVNTKLIVDLGAGHPLLIENKQYYPHNLQKTVAANLGIGLTGPVNGVIGRIEHINLGKFRFKDVITNFPDSGSKHLVTTRDGNLGLGILKKFSLIFDYQNEALYIKPNSYFKEPFEHDMSGLEYYATGSGFKQVFISRVEAGSAGAKAGFKENDQITAINFKPVSQLSLIEIDALFKSRPNRNILVEVYHDNKYELVMLTLQRRI